jgi:hypothetical protein
MNKIILLITILYNKTNTFIENINQQEYSIICEEENIHCMYIHSLYEKCGSLLFDIWLSLDLLLSVNADFNDYNKFYEHLEKKITIVDNIILKINENNDKKHLLDNEKLLFYIKKIIKHQIIKYNENILCIMEKCKQKIKKI